VHKERVLRKPFRISVSTCDILEEVGKEFFVTRERIRRIEEGAAEAEASVEKQEAAELFGIANRACLSGGAFGEGGNRPSTNGGRKRAAFYLFGRNRSLIFMSA
jgi:hypothetical protein